MCSSQINARIACGIYNRGPGLGSQSSQLDTYTASPKLPLRFNSACVHHNFRRAADLALHVCAPPDKINKAYYTLPTLAFAMRPTFWNTKLYTKGSSAPSAHTQQGNLCCAAPRESLFLDSENGEISPSKVLTSACGLVWNMCWCFYLGNLPFLVHRP